MDHVLVGGTVLGVGPADVLVRDGRIAAVGPPIPTGVERRDVSGKCIGAGFVDSHVHLAYRPEAEAMRAGGVVAAVDLGAPVGWLGTPPEALEVLAAGPLITAVKGYPTQSWGRAGYGLEVSGEASARAAVAALHEAGARVVKLALDGDPSLTEAEVRAAVEAAHSLELKVVAHALSDATARRAAELGVDALAHTPTEPLAEATVQAWSDGAVISTLGAFGGGPDTVENLRRLREAGATILYGTDFGNTRTAGIDRAELALLGQAGLDAAALRAAGTTTPASWWGLDGYGAVAVGKRADLWIGDCDCPWCG